MIGELNMKKAKNKSNKFQLSLLLILVSFVLLFTIAYKALSFQKRYLSNQSKEKVLGQLNQISKDYFAKLASDPLPYWAIPLPMEKPTFPAVAAPESNLAKLTLLKIALGSESKLVLLTEAVLNAKTHEQDFWRFLLLKEHLRMKNYFQVRKVAFSILNSNFDYVLPTGRTLKTQAILISAETFLSENNTGAFNQWIYRLRSLPAPTVIPKAPEELFINDIPESSKSWLRLLIFCYQKTYSLNLESGWKNSKENGAMLLKHETGLACFPADLVMNNLFERFIKNGFSDVAKPTAERKDENSNMLEGSNGLWIEIKASNSQSIPGGFFLLLILTTMGILGLFRFSLYEWQFIEKGKLLDEEEDFFRQTAHDIKTPLTTVKFLAETIVLKRYKNEEHCNKYLNQLLSESEKAAELIDQLLLSVRLRKQSIKADLKSISPCFRAKDILLRFKPRLSNWEVTENYLSSDEVLADPDMFDRVIINLIENVIRHASDGKKLFVEIREIANSRIALMVGDNGSGLPMIANKSGKLNLLTGELPYNKNRGGSGTGLLLIKQIVRTHSGEFYAEKKSDGGLWIISTWEKVAND